MAVVVVEEEAETEVEDEALPRTSPRWSALRWTASVTGAPSRISRACLRSTGGSATSTSPRITGLRRAEALDSSASTASENCFFFQICSLYAFLFIRNDAEDAIDALDGRKYDGRELSVQYAR